MKTAASIFLAATAGSCLLTHYYFAFGWAFWHPQPAIMFWLLMLLHIGGALNIEVTMWLEFFTALILAGAFVFTGLRLTAPASLD